MIILVLLLTINNAIIMQLAIRSARAKSGSVEFLLVSRGTFVNRVLMSLLIVGDILIYQNTRIARIECSNKMESPPMVEPCHRSS